MTTLSMLRLISINISSNITGNFVKAQSVISRKFLSQVITTKDKNTF